MHIGFKNLSPFLFCLSLVLVYPLAHAAPKWKKIISSSSGAGLQGGHMIFNQDTTWTVPAGVTKIQVMTIGAGGGGGGNSGGGGGGGGSCVKSGSTVLTSADGGNGGAHAKSGLTGKTVHATLTVTAGSTLDIFVGGGGGGGTYNNSNSYITGGSGGYGNCGSGGSGGNGSGSGVGGTGGLNKGGGGGAANNTNGVSATTSTGAPGSYYAGGAGYNCSATGGSATTPGPSSSGSGCAGGGASGGIGGCYFGVPGGLGISSTMCISIGQVRQEPGDGGNYVYTTDFQASTVYYYGTGGGPGAVYIWW